MSLEIPSSLVGIAIGLQRVQLEEASKRESPLLVVIDSIT